MRRGKCGGIDFLRGVLALRPRAGGGPENREVTANAVAEIRQEPLLPEAVPQELL
jgi:hypothetical protein